MTRPDPRATSTMRAIDTALAKITDVLGPKVVHADAPPPPPFDVVYGRCQDIRSARAAQPAPVLRTLHHFACSGGTVISKHLAAMPNTRLLSEVDPLSPLTMPGFKPSDLASLYREAGRPASDAVVEELFSASLASLSAQTRARGERLILRDHCHSYFCNGAHVATRTSMRDLLRPRYTLKSAVTVRHPLDSYLSLINNGWLQFTPDTLEEYAIRYMAFLDHYADWPLLKYEDFVADPDAMIGQLCTHLALPYVPEAAQLAGAIQLTGDSGRSGAKVTPRPRRSMPDAVEQMRRTSPSYAALCARLDYQA